MHRTMEELSDELVHRSIRLSHPRLMVLEYLVRNRSHPTVELIYSELHPRLPSLSKTTVYNTLRLLQEAGLVRTVSIDDAEARYDIVTGDHGHFQCEICGEVFDFEADIAGITSLDLNGFLVKDRSVHFKGRCPACLEK